MPQIEEYTDLLCRLISTPSISRNEEKTADIIEQFLECRGCNPERIGNNVIARTENWEEGKPTLMLNSHHDTVRPATGYTFDPFTPILNEGRLYGLGSNDAGASVVSLIACFLHFRKSALAFNIILAISAEEEVSGKNGISAVLPEVGKIDFALVGEPTGMQAAVGERGLVVLDCTAIGKSGHAARNEGVNALYIALDDIAALRRMENSLREGITGPVKITATQINCGTQHNVVPDRCSFVVDIRTNDAYTNEGIVELIRGNLKSEVAPRSTRLRASAISCAHPLVKAAADIGAATFVSPTMSDMALMPFPSLKMGPGDSARSHSADEFIMIDEIRDGITKYISFINSLDKHVSNAACHQ